MLFGGTPMSDLWRFGLAAGAALAAGAINAVAGGGSLLTFPALVAGGMPVVTASLTNTVAMCSGYVGATYAQRRDLAGQRPRLKLLAPASAIGGALGALLLLHTGDKAFSAVVPYLILLAAALLAVQNRLRAWLVSRGRKAQSEAWTLLPIGLVAVYGGYFGAGIGVMMLAAFTVVLGDTLTRLNALKHTMGLAINATAAVVFMASGQVDWPIVAVMFAASLAGGTIGGAFASKIPPAVLRWSVVAAATVVGAIYLVRDMRSSDVVEAGRGSRDNHAVTGRTDRGEAAPGGGDGQAPGAQVVAPWVSSLLQPSSRNSARLDKTCSDWIASGDDLGGPPCDGCETLGCDALATQRNSCASAGVQ